MKNTLVLKDRINNNHYSTLIVNKAIVFQLTTLPNDTDHVIVDDFNFNRFKLFINNGMPGLEPTTDAFVEYIQLYDEVSKQNDRLIIHNSALGIDTNRELLSLLRISVRVVNYLDMNIRLENLARIITRVSNLAEIRLDLGKTQ